MSASPSVTRRYATPLALAAALALVTLEFVHGGFPYDVLAERLAGRALAGVRLRLELGEVRPGWIPASFTASPVRLRAASGAMLRWERLALRPSAPLAWLRGRPSWRVAAQAPKGEVIATVSLGDPRCLQAQARGLDLEASGVARLTPLPGLAGRLDADLDLCLGSSRSRGSGSFELRDGRIALPAIGFGLALARAQGLFQLAEEGSLQVVSLELSGPWGRATGRGRVHLGGASALLEAPLELHATLEVRDPRLRALLAAQGLPMAPSGALSIRVTGSLAAPLFQPEAAPTARPSPRGGRGRPQREHGAQAR